MNTLIHQYFVKRDKLEDNVANKITFTKKLKF